MTERAKLRIAFDLDGVILNSMQALIDQYQLPIKYEDITQWDFTSLVHLDMKTVMQYFEDLDPKNVEFEMYVSNIEYLLRHPSFSICFLTDKTPKMLQWTQKVLLRASVGLENVPIYCSSQKELHGMWDILVEDKGETWEKCIALKRRCVLIDKPWNRSYKFQGAERYFSVNSFVTKMMEDYGDTKWRSLKVIIGIAGKMGSGKDTLAKRIGYHCYAFAGKLKEICTELFGITPMTKDTRTREILQKVGQFMRTIDPNVWVNYLIRHLKNKTCIITDVRYMNEAISILNAGGKVFYLDVSDEYRKHRIELRDHIVISDEEFDRWKQHPSEAECDMIKQMKDVMVLNGELSPELVYDEYKTFMELLP